MLPTTFGVLLAAAASITSVQAHGYVTGVLVDGKTWYSGYLPYHDPYQSPPIRRVIRDLPGNGNAPSQKALYASNFKPSY